MKTFLSIDWDYFIGCSATDRALLFPDGGNEMISKTIQNFIWNSHYSGSPKIRDINVLRSDYIQIRKLLKGFSKNIKEDERRSAVSISHRFMYDFVLDNTSVDETFVVYNVDFHHDMYSYRTRDLEVNCGNWVNKLLEKRPNMKYYWVKRTDSDTEVLGGKVDCETCKIGDIPICDYVFMCRSDCWSPPHLDSYFSSTYNLIGGTTRVYEWDALTERKIEEVPDVRMLYEVMQKETGNV